MKHRIGRSHPKTDASAISLGEPVYVDDFPKLPGTLYVKVLRSPCAHARICSINDRAARAVPGVVEILTWEDAPDIRYSSSGGAYPESSPYDRKILEQTVRYVGDEVALVAAETEAAARKALRLIRVDYERLPFVTDAAESAESNIVIHDELDSSVPAQPAGYDPLHNQISLYEIRHGDLDAALDASDAVHSAVYETQAQAHGMMETLRTYTYLAPDGRLTVVATTQAPYHLRRQVSRSLGLPVERVRVIKMRVGGGFGGKKVAVTEPLAGLVTLKTGRPAILVLDRKENFSATTTRHAMKLHVTLGGSRDGTLRAIRIDNLSNTGAYGEEGPAVTMVAANNILPSYNRTGAIWYRGRTIYTNLVPGGALRGYGATQGGFALECAVNELAEDLGIDPCDFRRRNMARPGDAGGVLHSDIKSCALEYCMVRGMDLIGWKEKYPRTVLPDDRVRAVGAALTTHRTSIPGADKSTVTLSLEPDGSYLLLTGAADLGTGADTVLAQIAAEALSAPMERIRVRSGDTDDETYDSGAFASSTTYVAGSAVLSAAKKLVDGILTRGAELLGCDAGQLSFNGERVYFRSQPERTASLRDIAETGRCERGPLLVSGSCVSALAPLTCMSGFAEIELDLKTGRIELLKFVSVADCGTVLNPALARVQAEGGIMMGIGLALYEDVHFSDQGKLQTNSFMQYKIPCREDVLTDCIQVEFAESSEPSGPYGAKSIGEASVHTVAPAIAGALLNAAGIRLRSLPFTPEKIQKALEERLGHI